MLIKQPSLVAYIIISNRHAYSSCNLSLSLLQAQYSLLCRSTEWELLEVCKREGIAMLPWSPLKGYPFIY